MELKTKTAGSFSLSCFLLSHDPLASEGNENPDTAVTSMGVIILGCRMSVPVDTGKKTPCCKLTSGQYVTPVVVTTIF